MKKTHVFLLLLLDLCWGFSSVLDNVNVDIILKNKKMVEGQINCIVYGGPCDRIGNEVIRILPMVLNNNCAICTTDQHTKATRMINFIKTNYPQAWIDLLARYQPSSLLFGRR